MHFIFRDQELQEMNFHEFVSSVDIVPKSKNVRNKEQAAKGHDERTVECSAQEVADEVNLDDNVDITTRG